MLKTKKVKKAELNGMLEKAIKKVEKVDIEVGCKINPNVRTYKATSYFGQIRYIEEDNMCEITISEYHLDNGHKAVMETLVHEVLHACKGAVNHGKQWQEYANYMNRVYGLGISRTGSSDNGHKLPDRKYKVNYIIECEKCENTIKRTRKSKLITHTDNYRCGVCEGKFKRVK